MKPFIASSILLLSAVIALNISSFLPPTFPKESASKSWLSDLEQVTEIAAIKARETEKDVKIAALERSVAALEKAVRDMQAPKLKYSVVRHLGTR